VDHHEPIAIGARLGPYEILGPIGRGGMGEVYRARDARLGREVAVKVLPADAGQMPDRLPRFEREAQAVAALNHPTFWRCTTSATRPLLNDCFTDVNQCLGGAGLKNPNNVVREFGPSIVEESVETASCDACSSPAQSRQHLCRR
jgi:serine/threonine protein kinase